MRQELVDQYDKTTVTSGDLPSALTTNTAYIDVLKAVSTTQNVEPIDQNQCKVGDKVTAGYKAVDNAKNGNSSSDEGSLLDAILKTLQEFVKSIIDALVKIITDIIIKVVDKVFQALSGIGGGIFANAFNEFSSGLKTEITTGLQNLGTDVKKTLDEAFPTKK